MSRTTSCRFHTSVLKGFTTTAELMKQLGEEQQLLVAQGEHLWQLWGRS